MAGIIDGMGMGAAAQSWTANVGRLARRLRVALKSSFGAGGDSKPTRPPPLSRRRGASYGSVSKPGGQDDARLILILILVFVAPVFCV